MNDRFNFRTWDKENEEYTTNSHIILSSDGVVRYIEDSNWYEDVSEYYDVEFCTGLKDKNGKLIYEGDIVKTDSGSIYYIQWDKKTSSFREEDPNLSDMVYNAGHHLSLWADTCCKCYTIIGNIHENPELIK